MSYQNYNEEKISYNEELEMSLIGVIFCSGEHWQSQFESTNLKSFHFEKELHQKVWIQLEKEAYKSNPGLDLNVIANRVGSTKYEILALAAKSSLSNSVKTTSKEILNNYLKKQVTKICQETFLSISKNGDDIRSIILNTIRDLENIETSQKGKIQSVAEIFAERNERQNDENYIENERYIEFGIEALDKMIGQNSRGKGGDLYSILAPTGDGKTAMGNKIAANLQTKFKKVGLIFTLEMSKYDVVNRLFSIISKIPLDDIEELSKKTPKLTSSQLLKRKDYDNFVTEIIDINLHISENINDFDEIVWAIKNYKRKFDIDFVVIDYLGLVESPKNYRAENGSYDRIGNMTKALKFLARKENVAIFQLCQTNQNGEVAESKKIIHDSDFVLMIERNRETNKTRLTVKKDRNRGNKECYVDVSFNKELQTFCNN